MYIIYVAAKTTGWVAVTPRARIGLLISSNGRSHQEHVTPRARVVLLSHHEQGLVAFTPRAQTGLLSHQEHGLGCCHIQSTDWVAVTPRARTGLQSSRNRKVTVRSSGSDCWSCWLLGYWLFLLLLLLSLITFSPVDHCWSCCLQFVCLISGGDAANVHAA